MRPACQGLQLQKARSVRRGKDAVARTGGLSVLADAAEQARFADPCDGRVDQALRFGRSAEDKGAFIGIVTRRAIMRYCLEQYIAPQLAEAR